MPPDGTAKRVTERGAISRRLSLVRPKLSTKCSEFANTLSQSNSPPLYAEGSGVLGSPVANLPASRTLYVGFGRVALRSRFGRSMKTFSIRFGAVGVLLGSVLCGRFVALSACR